MILSCKEYNSRQAIKHELQCAAWDYRKGGFPQVAFVYFWDRWGRQRITGFVSVDGGCHRWAKTKKELLKCC